MVVPLIHAIFVASPLFELVGISSLRLVPLFACPWWVKRCYAFRSLDEKEVQPAPFSQATQP